MKKPLVHRAWAVYGRHGGIYLTEFSPHEDCEGRFQVYSSPFLANRNMTTTDRIFEVEIRPVVRKKK